MVIVIVLLSICLIVSIIINFLLYKAALRQLRKSQTYEGWILDFKEDVLRTFKEIKDIDDRQMFEKDDDVGVVFQTMLGLISELNERTQEEEGEESR